MLFLDYVMCSANNCEEDTDKASSEKHQEVTGDNTEGGKGASMKMEVASQMEREATWSASGNIVLE